MTRSSRPLKRRSELLASRIGKLTITDRSERSIANRSIAADESLTKKNLVDSTAKETLAALAKRRRRPAKPSPTEII